MALSTFEMGSKCSRQLVGTSQVTSDLFLVSQTFFKEFLEPRLIRFLRRGELQGKPNLVSLLYNLSPKMDCLCIRKHKFQTYKFLGFHLAAAKHKAAALA